MLTHLLAVSHVVQEESAGCLAACAQMVLDYYGVQRSQTELNQLFETTSAGTPRSRLLRLERYGLRVTLKFGSELTISQTIDQNCPLIAFVRTGQLTSYWGQLLDREGKRLDV